MGWDERDRRRVAIRYALAHAAHRPGTGLPYPPEVRAAFRSRRELLLALQFDWAQALWARIEVLSLAAPARDAGDLVQRAWADCAAAHPVLRRVLDESRLTCAA